ncbi:MAG: hypothetical protein GY875_25070 [Gammaproteobacteria bacterium]|nr:hypothetical protein [Gammaproteobacteria bacterium]
MLKEPVRHQSNNLLGIGLMMLAMLLFEVMDAIAKWLVSSKMSAIQVIAIRSWILLPMILLILAIKGEVRELATRKPVRHMLRGCIGFFAPFARAEVSALAPFEYTALVWATIIGCLLWQDIPSTEVWTGAGVIIACGLYVIRRESPRYLAHSTVEK